MQIASAFVCFKHSTAEAAVGGAPGKGYMMVVPQKIGNKTLPKMCAACHRRSDLEDRISSGTRATARDIRPKRGEEDLHGMVA